jgi:hypothetical protein
MFELERALADERIKVGRFLKLVRKHARAEFMDLALANKVRRRSDEIHAYVRTIGGAGWCGC